MNIPDIRLLNQQLSNPLMSDVHDLVSWMGMLQAQDYVHQDCRTKGCRKKTLLLPSYDEYLLGYKSRHHAIEKDFCPRAYNRNGTFYPVIVQHGQVVGNWHPKKGADFFKDEYRMDISDLLKSYAEFADK